jgi:hypothetical protein
MTKTVWERNLSKNVEIIAAGGHLTLTPYSLFARIEWTGSEPSKVGTFEFIEEGPLPPNEIPIESPGPMQSQEEVQSLARDYLDRRKEAGCTVNPNESFDEWKSIAAE